MPWLSQTTWIRSLEDDLRTIIRTRIYDRGIPNLFPRRHSCDQPTSRVQATVEILNDDDEFSDYNNMLYCISFHSSNVHQVKGYRLIRITIYRLMGVLVGICFVSS